MNAGFFGALGGYTSEAPEFDAFWAGATLEFEVARWCALIGSASYYQDSGESLSALFLERGSRVRKLSGNPGRALHVVALCP